MRTLWTVDKLYEGFFFFFSALKKIYMFTRYFHEKVLLKVPLFSVKFPTLARDFIDISFQLSPGLRDQAFLLIF